MLEHLHVKNVALIDEIEIDFHKGLNILSGETGAGKSMIIDSINFLLGHRPGKDFIRQGETMALVEGLICICNSGTRNAIVDLGIEVDEDNMLLIHRSISDTGKSLSRVNGKTITIGMLKEISENLFDIHGQHEHQSLLNSARHIDLLDRFCGETVEELKLELNTYVKRYKEIAKDIKEIVGDVRDRESRIEILKYQLDEIDHAKLFLGEEEDLLSRKKILNNSEKLIGNAFEIQKLLYSGIEEEQSASDKISKSIALLYEIKEIDPMQDSLVEGLETALSLLEDVIREIRDYNEDLEYDPDEINQVESRLNLIYVLKRKYNGDIKEILEFREKISKQLDMIVNSEERAKKLNEEKNRCKKNLIKLCDKISLMRKQSAVEIKTQIEKILKDLGMKNARFDIMIEKKNEFNSNGYDKVEFLISPNLGEELKQLSKIASGGEMSRVMLALKTVLADVDHIETFIFDEIDAGVSGRTAQQVGEKLAFIGKKHQILCITHLPQIAAMGDNHFLIEKKSDDNKTTTYVYLLDKEQSIQELARLTGGAKITSATIKAASEMKELAVELKKKI